ncbi:hypothetical protein EJB05_08148, partial [Eragrostis curvula]
MGEFCLKMMSSPESSDHPFWDEEEEDDSGVDDILILACLREGSRRRKRKKKFRGSLPGRHNGSRSMNKWGHDVRHLQRGAAAPAAPRCDGRRYLARLLPELDLLDLPQRVPGQRVDDHHFLGHHEPRHAGAAVGDDVVLAHRTGGSLIPGDDEGARRLAPARVRHGDDGGVADGRVAEEHLLHLLAADVLPAADDHVLGPVLDLDVAVGVDHADVAGEEPAALEGGLVGLRVLEVPLHHAAPAQHDLADRLAVAGHARQRVGVLDVGVGEGQHADALPRLEARALGEREAVPLVAPLARQRGPRRLRQAVGVGDLEPDPLDALQQRRRRRGAAGEHVDRRVELLLLVVAIAVEEDAEDDGRAAHVRDAVAGDGAVDAGRVRVADADVDAAAGRHAPREGPAVAVEHGQRPQVDRLVAHPPLQQQARRAQVRAAVAVHDALGRRRRPRRVAQRHGVPLVGERRERGVRVAAGHQPLVLELAEPDARGRVSVVDHRHERDGRAGGRHEVQRVAGEAHVVVVHEEELGLRVAQDGGHRVGVEPGVDGVQHGAGHGHGEVHLVHGRHVGRQHGHHVVLADAQVQQRRRQAPAAVVRLAPGEAHAAVDDRRAVAVHCIGARQETHRAQRHVVRRALRKLLHDAIASEINPIPLQEQLREEEGQMVALCISLQQCLQG